MVKPLNEKIEKILWDEEPYMTLEMCLRISQKIIAVITTHINEIDNGLDKGG